MRKFKVNKVIKLDDLNLESAEIPKPFQNDLKSKCNLVEFRRIEHINFRLASCFSRMCKSLGKNWKRILWRSLPRRRLESPSDRNQESPCCH